MVLCLMIDCGKNTQRDHEVKFFRVPVVVKHQGEEVEELSSERRRKWIAAINRQDLTEKKLENDRVCSLHFINGEAAASWDRFNVDWVPTRQLGYSKSGPEEAQKVSQETVNAWAARARARRKRLNDQQEREASEKRKKLNEPGKPVSAIAFLAEDVAVVEQESVSLELEAFEQSAPCVGSGEENENVGTTTKESCIASVQTDEYNYMFNCSHDFTQTFEQAEFENDDERVRFYTGLPTFEILMVTFNHVAPHVSRRSMNLSKFQEFIMTLKKLRLNVPFKDLAYRFKNIHVSTVSRTFSAWMLAMDKRLSPMIKWPEREALWSSMPQSFQYSFGKKTTVIIDCFEVFMDRPSNLLARAQTFSSYKHHNTVKILIGITPQGTIYFTSEVWGGRTSDKYLTENCGFQENLLPGDMVMADRGFTITESVMFKQASLVIPAFTKGKRQLDPVDVEKTRGIASVRIHVERVIGQLRRKYTIPGGILPIDFLTSNSEGTPDERNPIIDRIIRVCSALVNLCPPIVAFA